MSDSTDASLLVVEDHPETWTFLEMALSEQFDVDHAASAAEAIEKIGDSRYDLLLIDIALPGEMNGIELLEYLRDTSDYSEIPAIAMTAHQLRHNRQHYLDRGFDDYLPKPFYPEDLKKAIDRLLGSDDNHRSVEHRPR